MAKDILNKSHLSEIDERIQRKVLNCKEYKPSTFTVILSKTGDLISPRLWISMAVSLVSLIPTVIIDGVELQSYEFPAWELLAVIFVMRFVITYIVLKLFMSDLEVKKLSAMLKRI